MKGPIIYLVAFIGAIIIFLIIDKIINLKKHNLITRIGTFKIIDRFLIISSILGILVSSLWDFNYLLFSKPIPYKNWESITLADFKGLNKPNHNLDGEMNFAFVSTNRKVKKHRNEIEIQSYFHPCKSYVYNRKLFSNLLLTHEMYHFHISEYCTRLMKKEIFEYDQYGIEYNLSRVKRHLKVYEWSLQAQYDEETYHSYVHGKQIKWQEKIDSLLITVEEYSNPIITLKNN